MKKQNRRHFLSTAALLAAGIKSNARPAAKKQKAVIHHVFFWLKNPASKEDLSKLIKGLQALKAIPAIRQIHIGVPASTEKRPVVESGYQVSELMFFDDLAGQKTYQDHPLHQKFIADCSNLWEKVIVYDSIDV